TPDASNQIGVDPQVVATYNTSVAVMPWRTAPGVTGIALVAVELPPNLLGNYHLTAGSPARNAGAASKTVGALTVNAPATDIDGNPRPSLPGFEIGADEYPVLVYLALNNNATLPVSTGGTLAFANEDIVAFNGANYDMVFDGSDIPRVGFPAQQVLAGTRIDDFAVLSPTRILMSFIGPIPAGRLPGIPVAFGPIDDSDIVQFDATALGLNTAGTFSIYFDGSDVGLTTNSEDVNSLEVLPNGDLVISTVANVTVPGLAGLNTGRHLLRCAGTFGETTACTWSVYFDGTDVGLNESSNEVIDGQAIAANGDLYLSTQGNFSLPLVPPLSGADEDIFVCRPISLGGTTICNYLRPVFFDGSLFGLGGNDVTGIELP
ncbi:MAG: choice-of-anchor Q domain-containing protein, partial [Chloroflexota bacterium]